MHTESGASVSDLIVFGHPCQRHQLRSCLGLKSARAGVAAAVTVRLLEDKTPLRGRVRLHATAPLTEFIRAC